MRSKALRRRGILAALPICAAALFSSAFPLTAGAVVYPPGGWAFAGDAEGWQEAEASCNVSAPSTCEASGEFDGSAGDPPGSLAAHAHLTLNAAALFESTVVLESPGFAVAEGGPATVHVDRQFSPGGLLSLAPETSYSVSLVDQGGEASSEAIAETLGEGDSAFAGRDGVVAVSAGHTYAIAIEATTTSLAAVGLLATDSFARFDNVSLSTGSSGGEGEGDGGAGGNRGEGALSTAHGTSETHTVVQRRVATKRRWRARHVFVRLRCPRRARHACTITAQGRFERRVRATRPRTVRLGRGRGRLVALGVKPRFRARIVKRKRLLVVQRLRAGKLRMTFARSRPVIRHR